MAVPGGQMGSPRPRPRPGRTVVFVMVPPTGSPAWERTTGVST